MALVKAVVVLFVVCMLMISCEGNSTKLRRKQVSVYMQDAYNVSDYIIVKGPNFTPITPVAAPFGTVYFYNNLVTETADLSKPIGNITGFWIASTHPYGADYMTPAVLTLSGTNSSSNPDLRGLQGNLAMMGIASYSTTVGPEPQPLTGGSGSFLFVLGTFTVVPIDVSTYTQVLRFDLDLYWPDYSF